MKLLFLGVKPGRDLENALGTHGFTVTLGKRSGDPAGQDLVVYRPKKTADLPEVAKLRKHHPHAWIAVIVPRAWLKSGTHQTALIEAIAKNDVWPEETWQATFWFSLQRALTHIKLARELHAAQTETQQLKTLYAELTASSTRLISQLEKDVGLATDIQRSMLPKASPVIPGVSITVKYLPAAGLGGDYYDIFEMGDRRHFGILMADSRTHGMAAALLSVLLKTRIEEMKDRFPDSNSFVEYLNREIQTMHQKELASLALLYGILDRSSLVFRFTVAGNLKPLLWRQGAPLDLSLAANPPLGGVDHFSFRESSVRLLPGDLLILHTDGLEAPLAHPGAPSAFERMAQLLKEKSPSPDPLEMQNELMALINRFVERGPLKDDLTLIHLAIDSRALYVAGASGGVQSSK